MVFCLSRQNNYICLNFRVLPQNKAEAKPMTEPANTTEDHALIVALQQGDHRAFEKLYYNHSKIIFWKLLRMIKDRHQAEELLQDLFVKVWEKRNQINTEYPFAAFLTTIAKNIVIDHHRRLARLYAAEKELQLTNTELSLVTEETVLSRETSELLNQAISQLPEQRRTAFKLCKLEGKTHAEAAQIMGISPNTVHNHLVKATQKLKAMLLTQQNPNPALLLTILSSIFTGIR